MPRSVLLATHRLIAQFAAQHDITAQRQHSVHSDLKVRVQSNRATTSFYDAETFCRKICMVAHGNSQVPTQQELANVSSVLQQLQ